MVSTFTNPVVYSAIRLGIHPFDRTAPVELWSHDSLETVESVIRAVYRQVLGNAHVMESERSSVADAESQLRSHRISVRDFIRQVAKSDLYRNRFFEPCSRNRFIELNFKHLLGRAPNSYSDIADHSNLLESKGFEAEIDSYLDSDEYERAFGENTVPYYRGYKSIAGQKVAGFANLLKLLRGASSHDHNLAQEEQARLTQAIMANHIDEIIPITGLADTGQFIPPIPPLSEEDRLTPAQVYQGYETFRQTPPVEQLINASADDIEVVIRAVYRQVMGNAHIMESERLTAPESQLRSGNLSVREFVRQLAKSELYRSQFVDNCYRYRAIELNFKHLLGRAPQNYEEMQAHSAILDAAGYEADIDSYIDSDEYQNAFGEFVVPYYRGYRTAAGQTMLEFTNMLTLLRSASSSDKDPATNNAPRLTESVITAKAPRSYEARPVEDILAEVFKPKPSIPSPVTEESVTTGRTPVQEPSELEIRLSEQDALIAKLREQLAELRPLAGIGEAITRKGLQASATIPTENSYTFIQSQTDENSALIERLRGELMEARALANIGEARLNKWRQSSFR
ncbi:phycobilisome rod-core linker polypeptide [Leptothoe spongobia]|uniref:Phycobilisome rod-core linker polypeptide n=1 Tax=Leptothoe spongobia TAU-MAC 1115 TaxID=1967444 RepID=A0A947DFH9_9CYAN|nr:phycobilisome rod-core linker polypeptide [Leptothoe spongobia]MBT9315618.1 phycobilisome rod-core linker polypeptide [Leptothoe spongobia TAU-MAC 1115]